MSHYTHLLALSEERHNKHTEREEREGCSGWRTSKGKSGFEEGSRGEGEVEVSKERGRGKSEWRAGGVERCGRRGWGGGGGMTKGDSCDANPIHPLARTYTHMCKLAQSACMICSLSS